MSSANRNDIGKRSVKPGLVEVEKGNGARTSSTTMPVNSSERIARIKRAITPSSLQTVLRVPGDARAGKRLR
ncbi:MAG: hypothetical protein IPO50_08535 [Sphingomonadales bacterium]|nr:hypothetical protein [Sphingomonadales bacterium]